MRLEALNTVIAAGTLLVILATAVAAVGQLRHLRISNQLSGLLSFLEILQSSDMRELLNYVRHDLPQKMNDPEFRDGLDEVPIDRAKHPELYVCQLFDHLGSHVRSGLIDEKAYLQAAWYDTYLYYTILWPAIEIGRRKRPFTFENFEYLAARAVQWRKSHPHGDYPSNAPRMAELLGDVK